MKQNVIKFFLIMGLNFYFSNSSQAYSTIAISDTNKQKTKEEQVMILIHTDYGEMKAVLYNETPLHRDNFIKLIKEGYYDSTLFHRVIDGFMIQGGDPESKNAKQGEMLGNGGPDYTIPAEFRTELIHRRGALAAARTGDNINPRKESSGSQFYISQGRVYSQEELNMLQRRMGKTFSPLQISTYTSEGGIPFLDYEYTVFGQVIDGLEVIDKIAAVAKDRFDRPTKDIKMTISIIKNPLK
jgi:peptidyl-prolyl cis-trans isomerase B (cyclophilin B)